jgi:hypothetical protein
MHTDGKVNISFKMTAQRKPADVRVIQNSGNVETQRISVVGEKGN